MLQATDKGRERIANNGFRATLLTNAIENHFILGKSWDDVEKSLYYEIIAALVDYKRKQDSDDDPNVFVEEHADLIDPLVHQILEGAKAAGAAFGE